MEPIKLTKSGDLLIVGSEDSKWQTISDRTILPEETPIGRHGHVNDTQDEKVCSGGRLYRERDEGSIQIYCSSRNCSFSLTVSNEVFSYRTLREEREKALRR